MNFDRGHGRRVLRQFLARGADHLVHLTTDMQTGFIGLLQSSFHDLFGNTVDLDVHLQGGYASL